MKRVGLFLLLSLLIAGTAAAQMSTTVGHYTLTFNGVQYPGDGTSVWRYTLLWDGTPPALSHLTIGLCNSATLVPPSQSPSIGPDGSTGLYGIKWDYNLTPVANTPVAVTFTLNQQYAVGVVQFSAKAGQFDNIGQIYGPSLSCAIAHPAIAILKSCPSDVFVGDTVNYEVTVTNSGDVLLTNVVLTDPLLQMTRPLGTLAAGASVVVNGSVSATSTAGITNTASVTGDYFGHSVSDTSSCHTDVYALTVSKTAVTHFDRDFDWTVTKSGDAAAEICHGTTQAISYTVETQRTRIDSGFRVEGTITVGNPAPIPAPVASVVDNLPGGSANVSCGVAFPYNIPAQSSLICSYSSALPNADDRLNTARAILSNGTPFDGTAAVVFGAPDTVTDATLTVDDVLTCPPGFTCSSTTPLVFGDSGSSTFTVNVTNENAMCNSYFDLLNVARWTDDGKTSETPAVRTSIYSCRCNEGCTLTIGYWKTHAGFTGRNPDNVTQYLPQWLGIAWAPASVQVTTASQAVSILSMSGGASNGIVKLYAQLLGARLNIARGASAADIVTTLTDADAYLATHPASAWANASKAERAQVLTWATLLDAYNNGLGLGPGHCD